MSYQGTAILGQASATSAQMEAHLFRRNPGAPRVAELYLTRGASLGVRGDLAFAQALLETNYFRYGGMVQPWQHNFGRLGAAGPEQFGTAFATPAEGVLAHVQRLYAWAATGGLPPGMVRADPGFDEVERGSARHVGDLSGRWPAGDTYGQLIDRILGEILLETVPGAPYMIEQAYLGPGSPNRPGACSSVGCWQGVRGIVIHRSASPSMDAQAMRSHIGAGLDGRPDSSHFVVDDQAILQLMPVGEVAYHTPGKVLTHLGVSVCEHNWGTPAWDEAYQRLVWLTAHLAKGFQVAIADISGHFWWDPLNRPYDPTHLGWHREKGKATGIFDWNQFIADVQVQLPVVNAPVLPAAAEPVRVTIVGDGEAEGPAGLLIGGTTYVPLRSYTAYFRPDAAVRWLHAERRAIVDLPPK